MLFVNLIYIIVKQVKKEMKQPYSFQNKLLYRNETCTNHHGVLSTSVSCFEFFLGVRLHGGSLPNFNFFNVNCQIFQQNLKFTSQIDWKQIFTTFLTIVWELLDV